MNAANFAAHPDNARLRGTFAHDARVNMHVIDTMRIEDGQIIGEKDSLSASLDQLKDGETLGESIISVALMWYHQQRLHDMEDSLDGRVSKYRLIDDVPACAVALNRALDAERSPAWIPECHGKLEYRSAPAKVTRRK